MTTFVRATLVITLVFLWTPLWPLAVLEITYTLLHDWRSDQRRAYGVPETALEGWISSVVDPDA